jgi:hypothetical protein
MRESGAEQAFGKLCLLGYTGRQDLREHTECVRSASVCASVTDSFSLQLMNYYYYYMLERVLLGIVVIIVTFSITIGLFHSLMLLP